MEQILLSFLFLSGVPLLSNAASTCYYPDGVASSHFVPCVDDDSVSSACCAAGDECLTNGLCKATGMRSSTAFWRNLCTDASWQSDACPKYCYNESTSHEASAQSSFVLACSNTTYCCATQSLALSSGNYSYCCDDQNALFTAAPPVHLSGPQNPLPLFTSAAPTSASTFTSVLASSASSASTNSLSGTESSSVASTEGPTAYPANNKSSSLSTGAEAGIGVGVAAVVIIIAAVIFSVRRSRAKRNTEDLQKASTWHSAEDGRDYGNLQHGQKLEKLANNWVAAEQKDKLNFPELANDGAKFELGGVRGPAELEGRGR